MSTEIEYVLCVKRKTLFSLNRKYFNGFATERIFPSRVAFGHVTQYIERDMAEKDWTQKQMIPYIVIRDHDGRVFCYQRTKQSGETRLRLNWSIGIGGHVNPCDSPVIGDNKCHYPSAFHRNRATIKNAALREFKEEVELSHGEPVFEQLGFVNDDSDGVGSVHFGIVLSMQLQEGQTITVKDQALGEPYFAPAHELLLSGDKQFEKWSTFVLSIFTYGGPYVELTGEQNARGRKPEQPKQL